MLPQNDTVEKNKILRFEFTYNSIIVKGNFETAMNWELSTD